MFMLPVEQSTYGLVLLVMLLPTVCSGLLCLMFTLCITAHHRYWVGQVGGVMSSTEVRPRSQNRVVVHSLMLPEIS
jgi:hypothetical protein